MYELVESMHEVDDRGNGHGEKCCGNFLDTNVWLRIFRVSEGRFYEFQVLEVVESFLHPGKYYQSSRGQDGYETLGSAVTPFSNVLLY